MVRPELDRLPAREIVELLLAGEARVLPAVTAAMDSIAGAAALVASRYAAGGRLIFVGAGTSGRLAWAEAAELSGTFGFDRSRIIARIAGGIEATDDDEDDLEQAESDHAYLRPGRGDVLIAVAASGRTPYTVRLAQAARDQNADVVAVVTVRDSPLADLATASIEAVVGPEVLRDSTRLGAGTAQKIVLNTLTTCAAALLGSVHGDLMIDVVGANAKLRTRVAGIVAEVAGCTTSEAIAALDACRGSARAAVLVIVRGLEPGDAIVRAAAHPTLRAALAVGT